MPTQRSICLRLPPTDGQVFFGLLDGVEVRPLGGAPPDSFSSTLLSSDLSFLSASSLLCFLSVHIVGGLTSKLPSANLEYFCLKLI